MNHKRYYIVELFRYLDESIKRQILQIAGIPDNRPDILITGKLSGWGQKELEEGVRWMRPHRQLLLALLLRMQDLSNWDIRRLVEEGDLSSGSLSSEGVVKIKIWPITRSEQSSNRRSGTTKLPLTDLTSASAMMSEMFIVLEGANSLAFQEVPSAPPQVEVMSGSIEFAVGGSLFASGLGLIVGCSAGLVAAPILGPAAGVALAGVGLIELVVGWKQKIAETQKLREETEVIRINNDRVVITQNRRLRELEIKIKELELEAARVRAKEANKDEPRFAASSLVPREVVLAQAKKLGLTEAYANYLLNRGLPTYFELKKYFADIKVESISVPTKIS